MLQLCKHCLTKLRSQERRWQIRLLQRTKGVYMSTIIHTAILCGSCPWRFIIERILSLVFSFALGVLLNIRRLTTDPIGALPLLRVVRVLPLGYWTAFK